MNEYYIYIVANSRNTVLYIGVTNNLPRRIEQHKTKTGSIFTAKYNVDKLVYYERYGEIQDAITREKQLKNGSRAKKEALINSINPEWRDLSEDFI
ncbi:MAG: GIY-YIG nuclease family protein [FCB group bacterium]|nr:GIY-YIG nuclease family protein [FCB group bacterium]